MAARVEYLASDAWSRYLLECERFSFFSTPQFNQAWADSFAPGSRVHALKVMIGEHASLLLPLIEVSSSRRLPLKSVVCGPEWTGVAAGHLDGASATVARSVAAAVRGFLVENVSITIDPLCALDLSGLTAQGFEESWQDAYVVRLAKGHEAWLACLDKAVRRQIQRSAEHGLETRSGGVELLDVFHELYRHSAEHHGRRMVYPKAFLARLLASPGVGRAQLYLTYRGESCVAGGLVAIGRREAVAWIGARVHGPAGLNANENRHAHVIQDLCREGIDAYNLGANPGLAGVAAFKTKLAAAAVPYVTYTWRNKLVSVLRGWSARFSGVITGNASVAPL